MVTSEAISVLLLNEKLHIFCRGINNFCFAQLNDLSGSLDTSLLHDVVIDTVGQLSANQKPDSQTNAATKPAAVAAEKAIKTMYDHVFSREVLQRNAKLG